MTNRKFEKKARLNRAKAVFFTTTFHALILGALFMGSDIQWQTYVPDVVQEWIGMETEEAVVAELPAEKKNVIRP